MNRNAVAILAPSRSPTRSDCRFLQQISFSTPVHKTGVAVVTTKMRLCRCEDQKHVELENVSGPKEARKLAHILTLPSGFISIRSAISDPARFSRAPLLAEQVLGAPGAGYVPKFLRCQKLSLRPRTPAFYKREFILILRVIFDFSFLFFRLILFLIPSLLYVRKFHKTVDYPLREF